MAQIYSQSWASAFSKPTYYNQTGHGGTDAAITGYPEIWVAEAVKMVAGGGPSGENVVDVDTSGGEDSGVAALVLGGIANPGTSDIWSAASGRVTFKQYFSSANASWNFTSPIVALAVPGTDAATGPTGNESWSVVYEDGTGIKLTRWTGTGNVTVSAAFAADNAWHDIDVRWQASTGSNLDGSISVRIDGVVVAEMTSVALKIDTDGDTDASGLWFGYYGFLGAVGPVAVYDTNVVTTAPTGIPIATPAAPQIQCAPQTQVGNGGKGNAGCNTGGKGFTRSYTGTWGTVPVHPDPPAHEALTGKEAATVEAWVEVTHIDYPSGDAQPILRANVPLGDDPTYEGGYKTDGLLAIGDVEHALGNEQGGFEAATVDISISEAKVTTVRELATDQDLGGDDLYVKVASDEARAAGTAPLVMMRAIVQQLQLQSNKQLTLSGVDQIFSDFGVFGPDSQFPSRTYGDLGRGAPMMTADTKSTPIVPLYGEKTDAGAVDPVTNAVNPKGLIPGVYLGTFTISGLTTPQSTTGKSLAQVVAELQASVTAGTTVADWGGIIGGDDAAALQALGTVPNTYDRLASVIGYADLDYLLAQGTTAAPVDQQWGILAFGFGPWDQFTQIFGSDLGGGDPQNKHDRTQLDFVSRAGSDLLVPGDGVCPWTAFTITNPDTGESFDLAAIGVRGPLLDDHLNGVVNITANGIGLIGANGYPIMGVFDALQHCLENFFYANKTAGPWVDNSTAPKYGDGTYKVNSASFATRQAYTAAALGGGGLRVSWYPDAQKSKTQWMADFQTWTESKLGFDRHGQLMVFGVDETLSTSTWPRIDHQPHIFGPLEIKFGESRENAVTGSCDYDPDASKFRGDPMTLRNSLAIAKYKNKQKAGQTIENPLVADDAQLRWLLQRRVSRLGSGETLITVVGRRDWLDASYDVGQGVLLTTEDGPGASGYVDQPCIVRRRKFSFGTQLVTLTLWDVANALLESRFTNGLNRMSAITDTDAAATVVSDNEDLAALVLL